jgi:hypothetical protein
MRVDSKFPSAPLASAGPQRTAAGQRFSLDGTGRSPGASAASASIPLAGLDALLALQGEGEPGERRRRTVRRGHDLLDALDKLKAALLSGRVGATQLRNLAGQLGAQRAGSGDPGLDDILAHIELRARVELAKLGHA